MDTENTEQNDEIILSSDDSTPGVQDTDATELIVVGGADMAAQEVQVGGDVVGRVGREVILPQIVTGMAAVAGLLVVISGVYTTMVEHPNAAIPAFLAALATIGGGILFYVPFARQEIPGFYRTPVISNVDPPPLSVPKYSRRQRVLSALGGTFLILLAIAFVVIAYLRSAPAP